MPWGEVIYVQGQEKNENIWGEDITSFSDFRVETQPMVSILRCKLKHTFNRELELSNVLIIV